MLDSSTRPQTGFDDQPSAPRPPSNLYKLATGYWLLATGHWLLATGYFTSAKTSLTSQVPRHRRQMDRRRRGCGSCGKPVGFSKWLLETLGVFRSYVSFHSPRWR